MDLRAKIVAFGVLQVVVLASVLFVAYYFNTRAQVIEQYVEKARSVLLTTEATREEVGQMWEQGIFSQAQLSEWAAAGEIDKVMAAVPVVTALEAAAAKAEEGGYAFRAPKFEPRNPKNKPDALEARVLRKLKEEQLDEYYEIDTEKNAIRYFRPVRLTADCLMCHGDPAQSMALWGNDQGLDPTGTRMENWKVGEIHGAFEVVQSLDAADAAVTASLFKGGLIVGALVLVAAGAFFYAVTRNVIRPVDRIIAGLNDGAGQVNEAAGQVASAGQDLAASCSEQASAIEQTSAALEQMAAQTKQNASGAAEANGLAERARAAADGGGQTIAELNQAMAAIDTSANEISKIIKAIEEIAFQTNLLALNAAVEAARAGEHGKGFAVVAEEVRNLAQRSAQAAADTNSLIAAAIERAQQGSTVANRAGDDLQAIIADVTQVATLIGNISTASNEQAEGVGQINGAVTQMDRATQQNAATAEESASAAEELSAQAQVVKGVVDDLAVLVRGRSDGGRG